jgi:myo-inositol-1(or 4)-monophosphatase
VSTGDPPSAHELRILCERLAREAGSVALKGRGDRTPAAATKSSRTDMVTEHDLAAERSIRATLERERPGDAVVGEEEGSSPGNSGYRWSIDPIDGTTNFAYGLPLWATSVAVALNGTTIAGAVVLPALDRVYSAHLGGGATRDDRPISVSSVDQINLALVGTGFGYSAELRSRQARTVARLIGEVRDIRRTGSAAVDLCLLSDGSLDVYYEEHLNEWDVAAGLLIAAEAGATVSDLAGAPAHPGSVLACSPGVHDRMLDLLVRARDIPSDG